mgnify:FL=1|jgi:hypothetical protein
MKKIILVTVTIFFTLVSSCLSDDNDLYEFKIALTHEEIDDLLFLREEEKLARDVYLYSYNKYNVQIFKNISNSEIQHMNNVLQLLNKYNLQDSASPNIGEFNNVTLQSIYNELIIQSDISLLEALKVGDKIEDLDIRDIGLNEARTSKLDILSLYSTLKCGSRNHLRNFNNQVLQNNGFYIPEFISQEEFNDIISTSNKKCNLN